VERLEEKRKTKSLAYYEQKRALLRKKVQASKRVTKELAPVQAALAARGY